MILAIKPIAVYDEYEIMLTYCSMFGTFFKSSGVISNDPVGDRSSDTE